MAMVASASSESVEHSFVCEESSGAGKDVVRFGEWYGYSCESTVFFFFFSSRRRHTRFDCDWSSDVCSSDLERPGVADDEGTPANLCGVRPSGTAPASRSAAGRARRGQPADTGRAWPLERDRKSVV